MRLRHLLLPVALLAVLFEWRSTPRPAAPGPTATATSLAASPPPPDTAPASRTSTAYAAAPALFIPTPGPTNVATTADSLPATRPGEDAFATFHDWVRRRIIDVAADPEGIASARKRREELVDLIQANPRRALEVAVPDDVRALLPAAILEHLEERVAGRGDLDVVCALPEPGKEGQVKPLRRFARLDGRRFEAFVYGRRLGEPTLRGASLHGIALDGVMAVDESPVRRLGAADVIALAAAEPAISCPEGEDHPAARAEAVAIEAYGVPTLVCSEEHAVAYEQRLAQAGAGGTGGPVLAASAATEGLKRLLLIRVDFSDLPGESFDVDRAADLAREVHQFYQENSYGRAGFSEIGQGSAVTEVFRLPRTAASYGGADDPDGIRDDARRAARDAGYVLGDYDYDVICMRNVPGFGWTGLGFIGAPGAWIRGTSSTGVTAHELGHNFGLVHANFWDTGGATIASTGTSIEYGDKFDTMGAANAGNYHFNARYKRLLGWLKEGEYAVATTNGTYRVYAHDQGRVAAGSRGLQIFANANTNYWLEHRRRFTGNTWLLNGVGLRWAGRGNEASLLLDTTPGSAREKDDSALLVGRTYSDAATGIHLTPVARGDDASGWVDVVVNRGVFPANRPPRVQLEASPATGASGATFTFRADAVDSDGDALAYDWDFGDDSIGSNAPVVTRSWTGSADRVVRCTVSDLKGGLASAAVVVRVGSPSTLRLSGRVTVDGEGIGGVRVSAGQGRRAYTVSDGTYTLVGLARGSYTLTAASDNRSFVPLGFTNPLALTANRADVDFAAVDQPGTRLVTLVAAGSKWRYWDKGTLPGADWPQTAFDDKDWNVGPAILGYGGDKETTVISFGANTGNKQITAWFRRAFVVADPGRLVSLKLGLLRDDGAAVYLNGREILRDNLPGGALTASTRAASTVGGTDETTYFEHELAGVNLVAGTNVLAVEVHQSSPTSSDTAFDLRLTADLIEEVTPGIRLARPAEGDVILAPAPVVFSTAVGDLAGRRVRRMTFFADSTLVGSAARAPFAFAWRDVQPGEYEVRAEAEMDDGSVVATAPARVLVQSAELTPTLIRRGSAWRFLDTGISPPETWAGGGFDDGDWKEGVARFGYGEDGEFTRIDFGPNASQRHVTTWFRRELNVRDAWTYTNLVLRVQRDDGVAVYLNGREVFRNNLRTGAITPTLLAQTDVREDAEQAFLESTLLADGLVEGRNVVAAEVHQVSRTSSDVGFDLELIGTRWTLPPVPRLQVRRDGGRWVLGWSGVFADMRLETAPTLSAGAAWRVAEGVPARNGDRLEWVVPRDQETAFFRLGR